MPASVYDLLQPDGHDQTRFFGVAVGIITDNKDPQKQGRVRMQFPWLSDDHVSDWSRVSMPMAGNGRGVYFLPEIGDEVLVAFQHGDVRFPYVVGSMWNGQDAPPANNDDGENNIRVLHSRSGHLIRLDDTSGAEKIEIIDKTGNNSLTIESASNNFTITCNGTLTLQATQGVEITSEASVAIKAASTLDMEATGQTTLKGALVNIN